MEEIRENKKLIHKLNAKFRLVLLQEETFKEKGYVKFSRLNLITLFSIFILLFIAVIWSLIAYTPIRELVPGYPDVRMRNNIIQNKIRLDSLEMEIQYRDQYFANLKAVIEGEQPVNTSQPVMEYTGNLRNPQNNPAEMINNPTSSRQESNAGLYSLVSGNRDNMLENVHFFSPVRGLVTNSFNPLTNHYGADVVAGPNEVVKATLDGTITMASWTLETGHVIQIQHEHNLISVYKHNAELLKKVGTRVKAGDAIAIIGNSGELTTGPHLHFELWQNGVALNPENYILF